LNVPTFPVQLGIGILLLVATAVVRATTVNRLVRRKLRLPFYLAVATILLTAARAAGLLSETAVDRLRSVEILILTLGVLAFAVVVAVNPLHADRVHPRFPNILQDAFIVGLFLIVATVVMQEKFLTTSAVGAVVVGFALQDTLGNAFAGLAIQTEKPFHAGQWIRIGNHEGCVEEITWRATKLRTRSNTFVVVPNSVMSREAIENFSEPVIPTRISVDVGASYSVPPNDVKSALIDAIGNAPLALRDPPPEVLLVDFGSSAILYRARFWVDDYGRDELAKDQVRTNIYYTFKRRDIEIPYPIQVEFLREEGPARPADLSARLAELIGEVELFADLDDGERRELADMSSARLYAAGETIVRQGEAGDSMFVVASGRVRVALEPDRREIATMQRAGFLGEMSLLTGDARRATVSALTDCLLMEITSEAFRRFVTAKPSVLACVTEAVIVRQDELHRSQALGPVTAAPGPAGSFLAKVRRFLRLPA
jgi:small-conductance mechanosensitive channel/CRP-like cAMP-binding protein